MSERPIHPAALDEETLLSQCEMTKGRSSGPGGQNRNKVETKVTLTHGQTGVSAHAGERRSAIENRRVAVFRLRLALATEVRIGVPAGEVRSALWLSRCKDGRVACNPEHWDFPSLLGEALDVIYAAGLDARKASVRLCCTMTQLVKLVKDHPAAFEKWNRDRAAKKMHPMK